MAEIITETEEGGILSGQSVALARMLLSYGHVVGPQAAAECVRVVEETAWRPYDADKSVAWGLALWPCGHFQAIDGRTRRVDWEPRPSHWRAVYVPPGLVTGGRYKPLAGSLVCRPKLPVPVQVEPK